MRQVLARAVLATGLLGAGAAFADDDDCRSPMSQWQTQNAAVQHATGLGIAVRRLKIDDGCYEIKGSDSDGNRVDLTFEPASLALRRLEVGFRDGADPSRYLKGARAPAAMQRRAPADNPLFEEGSEPKVEGD